MELIKSKKASINYLAKIVKIDNFGKHPNPEVTRLKCAYVDGFNIIVGIDEQPGLFVYFPTNSQINPALLRYANLYRHTELNDNPNKSGFFNDNGRVTAIKLKGLVSEGFLLPWDTFNSFLIASVNIGIDNPKVNLEFDIVSHNGKEFWINKKYIVVRKIYNTQGSQPHKRDQKNLKRFNRIIENQFRFHYDTELLKKSPWVIQPDSLISITEKIHGISGISAYVLCKKNPSIWNKIKGWFGAENTYYDYLYASRTIVKNAFGIVEAIHPSFINSYSIFSNFFSRTRVKPINKGGYYGVDVWKYADDVVRPYLQKGMTIYYEIVGFLPNGRYIQKDYDYGCVPPTEGEVYTHEKHFKVRIYRITMTNVDGIVHEFSAREVQQFCEVTGLTPVTQLYYGYAKNLYPKMRSTTNFSKNFIAKLAEDTNFYMEMPSPSCNNIVPHEGIVIKIEDMIPHAWKLKCFAFLNKEQKELDKGEENIEDNA